MKKYLLSMIFLIQGFFLYSCSTVPKEFKSEFNTEYINKKNICFVKPDKIYLFFEGDKLDFEYTVVGYIEIDNYGITPDKTLDVLKYEAWSNCADGIISIPEILKINPLKSKKKSDNYFYPNASLMSCPAIKIKRDSNFIKKYVGVEDTSFVKSGKSLKYKQYLSQNQDKIASSYFEEFKYWKKESTSKPDQVYLFYKNDSLDFEYEVMGTIDVKAGAITPVSDFKDLISYEAWYHCADAVIGLPNYIKYTVDEKEGINFQSNQDLAIKMTFMAIKINKDDRFIKKYGNKKDTSFVVNGIPLKIISNQILHEQSVDRTNDALELIFGILGGLGHIK